MRLLRRAVEVEGAEATVAAGARRGLQVEAKKSVKTCGGFL